MEFKEIKEPKYCVDNLMYYHLIHEKIIPFWKPNGNYGFCSQWYKSEFKDDLNIKYNCAEQYMMAQKALLFNDEIIYNKIMHEYNPSEIKRLGRLIRNFDSIIWDTMKYEIVFRGNMLKFSQNKSLAKKLKDTGKNILVEASPYDYVWGIGISEFSDNINEPELWPGKNLLGFALMEVRDNI